MIAGAGNEELREAVERWSSRQRLSRGLGVAAGPAGGRQDASKPFYHHVGKSLKICLYEIGQRARSLAVGCPPDARVIPGSGEPA